MARTQQRQRIRSRAQSRCTYVCVVRQRVDATAGSLQLLSFQTWCECVCYYYLIRFGSLVSSPRNHTVSFVQTTHEWTLCVSFHFFFRCRRAHFTHSFSNRPRFNNVTFSSCRLFIRKFLFFHRSTTVCLGVDRFYLWLYNNNKFLRSESYENACNWELSRRRMHRRKNYIKFIKYEKSSLSRKFHFNLVFSIATSVPALDTWHYTWTCPIKCVTHWERRTTTKKTEIADRSIAIPRTHQQVH